MRIYDCFEIEDRWADVTDQPAPARDLRVDQPLLLYSHRSTPSKLSVDQTNGSVICAHFSLEFFSDGEKLWLAAPSASAAEPVIKRLNAAGLFTEFAPPPTVATCPECGKLSVSDGKICLDCLLKTNRNQTKEQDSLQSAKDKDGPPKELFWFVGLILLVLAAFLIYGYLHKTPPPTAKFYADRTTIHLGESLHLSWTTTDATQVTVGPDQGQQNTSGSLTVSPRWDTTYSLNASGTGGNTSQQIYVSVLAPEKTKAFIYFRADRYKIKSGETVHLQWGLAKGESLLPGKVLLIRSSINSQNSGKSNFDVTSLRSFDDTPTESSNYTLRISRPQHPDFSKTIAITVETAERAPAVSLSLSPEFIGPCQSTTLSWRVAGHYDRLRILPGSIDLTSRESGSITVRPLSTTDYTLVANWNGGPPVSITKTVSILNSNAAHGPPGCGEILWTGKVPEGGLIHITCDGGRASSLPEPTLPMGSCIPHYQVYITSNTPGVTIVGQPSEMRSPQINLHSSATGDQTIHLRWDIKR